MSSFLPSLFRRKSPESILRDCENYRIENPALKKALGVFDLTLLGIAALIGAGIFSTIGNASASGGPAVTLLFIFTAVACGFSALCYAQFASSLPVSGSAYTYAYASLGELLAWIIGWDLLLEYAIGNIAVAISWSDYFTSVLTGYGIKLPEYLCLDYLTASRSFTTVQEALSGGIPFEQLTDHGITAGMLEGYHAWEAAPRIFGLPLICDLPALLVTVLVTWIVYLGIQESKKVSNFMVGLKLAVLALVIILGAYYIDPANWVPFAPNGLTGVMKGVSAVFFAYIGFDAISSTAEECTNPQKDLPRAMFYSLIVCTILYCAVALVLTGMVPYQNLGVGDPLAFVFGPQGANIPWISGIIALSAVIAMFTVLLVFQIGQPRLWMVMSRDGLLPKKFAEIHPKNRTPGFSVIVTGFMVGIPALFMNLTEVTDLTSIGTLFAFVIVCAGVLVTPTENLAHAKFKVPYINGRKWVPIFLIAILWATFHWNSEGVSAFFSASAPGEFQHKIPLWIFLISMTVLCTLTIKKQWSLIPLLGIASCGYLMTELGTTNWIRFGIWLLLGLVIYFVYSYKNSRLAKSL